MKLFIFGFILLVVLFEIAWSIPLTQRRKYKTLQKKDAWCEMKKNSWTDETVSGFVGFSQKQGNSPSMLIYGQWDTGFNNPDIEKYSFNIVPANYKLTEKLRIIPHENGATEPWNIKVEDLFFGSNLEGTSLTGEQTFEVRYDGTVIGSAPINIVG
ncbi:hypothetical protein G9A89_000996 [Geosiphon pyriformis]|nr:hypothetical protein G9A89_000996 [Geosiphon pyriformis]